MALLIVLPLACSTVCSPVLLAAANDSASIADGATKTVSSPKNRVAVLELYTSEGCSSCPPAERFLNSLRSSAISDEQLIPMAFHVTYWDYIGWQDRFADKRYDQRQRDLAYKHNSSSIYTPQFVLSGDDYRRYVHFDEDVTDIVKQKASVDLVLSASETSRIAAQPRLKIALSADASKSKASNIAVYLVVLENNLSSDIDDGENAGETLHHDFVVRQMSGPYRIAGDKKQLNQAVDILLQADWKPQNLSVAAFAENSKTGEVLQAVKLDLF